jgi:hypothetical protein
MTRLLIFLASWLVPAESRPEWRREWESEMWHARQLLRERGWSHRTANRQVRAWAWGSLADAACLGFDRPELVHRAAAIARTPSFCLGSIVCVMAAIALMSGFLPATRAVLTPLPYAEADRIATISQGGGSLAMRAGSPRRWLAIFASRSITLDAIASYTWRHEPGVDSRFLAARVSPNFFPLLGVHQAGCSACVLVSAEFNRRTGARELSLHGHKYRVAGVLPSNFWFLSRGIGVWEVSPELDARSRIGLVVRTRPGIKKLAVENELHHLAEDAGYQSWDSLVDVSPVQQRVHSSLSSFALALCLALLATILAARPRLLDITWRRSLFFAVKSTLLMLAVLLATLEFTGASTITMIGGTDLLSEPLSTWLALICCMTALTWSVHDQKVRCRVCLHRLALPAHVGCPGCILLNWAGTEMVCVAGHGMLHVPEMESSWIESEHWTKLDDSWRELFPKNA